MSKLFDLGRVVATPGVINAFEKLKDKPETFIKRHQSGDWGDLCDEDKRINNLGIMVDEEGWGGRLMSVYYLSDGTKIWIITEADRSVTTLLLPEEY